MGGGGGGGGGSGLCLGCIGRRVGIFLTAALSLLTSIAVLLPAVYCLVRPGSWAPARAWLEAWLGRNHWDAEVVWAVLAGLDWLDKHSELVLIPLVAAASTHLLAALLLVLGAMLRRRGLLVPWLITDSIVILAFVLVFVGWSFLSFFVDLLIAMVFPMVASLVIGLWVVLWRNTLHMYSVHVQPSSAKHYVSSTKGGGYTSVPGHQRSHVTHLKSIQEE